VSSRFQGNEQVGGEPSKIEGASRGPAAPRPPARRRRGQAEAEAGLAVEIVAGRIFVHWLALAPIPGDPPLPREISRAIPDASAPHGFRFIEV